MYKTYTKYKKLNIINKLAGGVIIDMDKEIKDLLPKIDSKIIGTFLDIKDSYTNTYKTDEGLFEFINKLFEDSYDVKLDLDDSRIEKIVNGLQKYNPDLDINITIKRIIDSINNIIDILKKNDHSKIKNLKSLNINMKKIYDAEEVVLKKYDLIT